MATNFPKPVVDFLSLFGEEYESGKPEAQAIIARRGMYDVQISSGRIFARVEAKVGSFLSVECEFPVLKESKISQLVSRVAGSALLFAHMLEGEWCPELEELLSSPDTAILPGTREDMGFSLAGRARKKLDPSCLALLLVVAERFSNDPLQIFLLSGHGREELLARIRHERILLGEKVFEKRFLESLDLSPEILLDEARYYHYVKKEVGPSYQLKADEIPAAILRRVDAPPLLGMEAAFETELQEIYSRVASRAQAYAMQIAKEQ